MKIITNTFNKTFFWSLYICYLINFISALHLRTKLKLKSKLGLKSHLLPSTGINCEALCLECSLNDLNSCIVCQPGIFEFNNKCYKQCPEGTYPDEEWQVCRACDNSCPICWGPTSDQCGDKKGVKITAVLLENEIKEYFFNQKLFNHQDIIKANMKIHDKEADRILIKKNDDDNNNNDNNELNYSISPAKQEDSEYNSNEDYTSKNDSDDAELRRQKLYKEMKTYNLNWLNKINVILKDVNPKNVFPPNHKSRIAIKTGEQNDLDNTISIGDVYGSTKITEELPIGSFSRQNGVFIPIPSYLDENTDIVESHWIYVKGSWLGNKWIDKWVPSLPSFIKHLGRKNRMYFENGGYWIYDNRKGI